ncbi:unnamed protein product, partial [Staurois parvus]
MNCQSAPDSAPGQIAVCQCPSVPPISAHHCSLISEH